jgi:hypothetical protein
MVCKKCEKKLDVLITPDTWKSGSKNTVTGSAGRRLNENKLLTKGKNAHNPMGLDAKCKNCKKMLHNPKMRYCQPCSYKNGICAGCGVQTLDVTFYKQTTT